MAEDLLKEVQQDIEYEKYQRIFLEHGNKLITAAIIILLFTAGFTIYKNREHKKSLEVGDMFINAFDKSDPAGYDAIIAKDHKGYSPLAALMKAGLLNASEKYDDAYKTLEKASGNYMYDDSFRQMAMIDQAYIMIQQKADKAKILAMLDKPSQDNAPFHATAQELKASYLLQQGDKKQAIELYRKLANNKEIASTQQERVKHILATINE